MKSHAYTILYIALSLALQLVSIANSLGQNPQKPVWVERISSVTPLPSSDISGRCALRFRAEGMDSAEVRCWTMPDAENFNPMGHDAVLWRGRLKNSGNALKTVRFNADRLPHGPLNIRILAQNSRGERDIYELQVYNTGGTSWQSGIPAAVPPAAKGMRLVFEDDFSDPRLSISNDGRNARYNAHKPTYGDFSGWPFTDVTSTDNPFSQRDTYLKISARKRKDSRGSTGLLASVDMNGKGFWVKAPCYLECRFLAQSAPGTWPAFWTLNQIKDAPGDELDIIEAYGGYGEGNPNFDGYWCTAHFWLQKDSLGNSLKGPDKRVEMQENGGASWSQTFHTYGLYIGTGQTIYYLDNKKVFSHPTNSCSRNLPHFFLVNYAIGGASGWKIDLERYGNSSDMYVDFIRVFEGY